MRKFESMTGTQKETESFLWRDIFKIVQIIKCTCNVFIDNFRNNSSNSSILVSVCRGRYGEYVKHKRNDSMGSQGNEKMQFLFLLLFVLTF